MEICFKIDKNIQNLRFNKICILFGPNNSGKSKILSNLKDYIKKESNNITINGNKIEANSYNVIYFDEETDFSEEFKFSKTNVFKSIIYDDIINSINKEKMLDEINSIFDTIDVKVNKYVQGKLKKMNIESFTFDTNINDINKIIEKFTDIYFNELLLSSTSISKSIKRKLIYQLLLIFLESHKEEATFVIIDNFDVYLDSQNTLDILNLIEKYVNTFNNVYFIISTNKNIYSFLDEQYSVYKVKNNNLINFNDISSIMNIYILHQLYNASNKKISYDKFANDNSYLITKEDLDIVYKKLFLTNKDKIGNILINDNISLLDSQKLISQKNTKETFITYNTLEEKIFFEIIKDCIDNTNN